mmetsp:Transcript_25149/g.75654  ORF Transcript_25149/g.75654 Transcript_25149/m.75654 type:complete len:120 (-) Transcript_25149:76-435(-)
MTAQETPMGIDTRMPSTLQSEITVRFSHSAHPRSGVRPATTPRRGQTTRRRRDEVSGDRERIFVDPRPAGVRAAAAATTRGGPRRRRSDDGDEVRLYEELAVAASAVVKEQGAARPPRS